MNRVVADALRQRGYNGVMAVDVGMEGKADEDHLVLCVTKEEPARS
ncbi:MAG: hypothetical protein KJ065_17000 [Anaerolineae bacterium]|nr:hypothetical protein [Anaerolineae bacterium]